MSLFNPVNINSHSLYDGSPWLYEVLASEGQGAVCYRSRRTAAKASLYVPPGWALLYHITTASQTSVIVAENTYGWRIYLETNGERAALWVCSPNPDEHDAVVELAQNVLKEMPLLEVPDDRVNVQFWFNTANGPRVESRNITAPAWKDISRNYGTTARAKLDQLMALRGADIGGSTARLVVFHGPPGTGKTSALRALACEWKSWCETNLIMDPERLFGQAEYLAAVLAGSEYPDDHKWRLLIIEDADDFLRADSKDRVGQSLSRLLNVGDGFIGQGLRLLVVMTVNSPIAKLQPAVTRQGRCLANIEVPKLTSKEATEWLGEYMPDTTLADCYMKKGDIKQIGEDLTTITAGQYL